MSTYTFIPEGTVAGIEYVTVLDATGDPIEYTIPREQADRAYPIDGGAFTVTLDTTGSIADIAPDDDGDWECTIVRRDPNRGTVQSEEVTYYATAGEARAYAEQVRDARAAANPVQ